MKIQIRNYENILIFISSKFAKNKKVNSPNLQIYADDNNAFFLMKKRTKSTFSQLGKMTQISTKNLQIFTVY